MELGVSAEDQRHGDALAWVIEYSDVPQSQKSWRLPVDCVSGLGRDQDVLHIPLAKSCWVANWMNGLGTTASVMGR